MTRWFSRRWVWAAVTGAVVVAAGAAAGRGDEPPKVGSTVNLPLDGKTERPFRVVKTEKQKDGTYLSELKDINTGETITLLTRTGDDAPRGPAPADDSKLPKAKPRANDPLLPPMSALPDPQKDKHPLLGRLFGDKDKPAAAPATGTPAPPKSDPAADAVKKPGLFARIFGPKKPAGPAMPAATAGPVVKPSSSTPPPVLPTPPGGLGGDRPAFPAAGTPPFPAAPTGEPPRVMPARPQPVAPPVPAGRPTPPPFPAPTPMPMSPAEVVPAPVPVPLPPVSAPPPVPAAPAVPVVPTVPAIPAPVPVAPPLPAPLPIPPVPSSGGIPPIPVPPGGVSSARPIQVVVPVGYVPPQVAFDREVEPFVIALQSMTAPSARLTAAKGLADGRYRSTDGVKGVLFQAAQLDPCGEVRAACIAHLCDLGYFSPQFLGHIQTACQDTDPLVRDAAKAACEKMIRK